MAEHVVTVGALVRVLIAAFPAAALAALVRTIFSRNGHDFVFADVW